MFADESARGAAPWSQTNAAGGPTRHIVYVADANWHGPTGMRSITEDGPPQPSECRNRLIPGDRHDDVHAAR